jgi:hypothetical protein
MSKKNAYWDRPKKIGNITLRPPTAGMMEIINALGLSMFTGEQPELSQEEQTELSQEEQMRQMFAFAWAHSAPLEEVWEALDAGAARAAARKFQWSVPMSDIQPLSAAVKASIEVMTEAQVEVIPKPSSSGEENAPPNS